MKVFHTLEDRGEVRRHLQSLFGGRQLVVATMHRKEEVIGPRLEEAIGVQPILPGFLDTDRFGTFSGEVERKGSPLEVARQKAMAAMEKTGATLAVASEGSFGPHPQLFFVPADIELLLFVDQERGMEIPVQVISTATNFSQEEVSNWELLEAFARKAGFPEHGLILKDLSEPRAGWMQKGIQHWEQLEKLAREGWSRFPLLSVETDMRALYNPSRMAVIAQAVDQLVDCLYTLCPQCRWPGFSVQEREAGLPCELCGLPTRQLRRWIYQCVHCQYQAAVDYPEGRQAADPTYCDFCNP